MERQPSFVMRMLRGLFIWARAYFAFVGFLVTVLPLVLVYSLAKFTDSSSKVTTTLKNETPATLALTLSGPILERSEDYRSSFMKQVFGRPDGIYLPNLRSKLRIASTKDTINDLHIKIDEFSGSLADMSELRRILTDFKGGGKKITAYASNIGNGTLYIGSVADEFILAPAGSVILPGPAITQIYFGDFIRKLGVDLQVLRAGKFKSAFETLIKNEPSPESKEEYSSLEASLREHMVKEIAQGRKKSMNDVQNWFRKTLFTPEEAEEGGMVDGLDYPSYIGDENISEKGGVAYLPIEDFEEDHSGLKDESSEQGLALIEAVGEIHMDGEEENIITPEMMIPELRWAAEESEAKAVVIRVSSPGGSATASDLIWQEVKKLAAVKPVIISMGAYAASGGYYISVAGAKLFAEPTTVTGSIGVISLIPNFSSFKDKWGVSFYTFTQSERLGLLNPGTKLSAKDKEMFEQTITDIYDKFKARVAEGRKLPLDQVEALAQGRVYTGEQALKAGLVDQLGGLKEAFAFAKKEGGLDPEKLYPVHRYSPAQLTLAECLRSAQNIRKCLRRGGVQLKQSLFSSEELSLFQMKNKLEKYSKGEPMTYWPGKVTL